MIEDKALVSTAIGKDGVWQVPADKRPDGWEKMGLREAESTAVAVAPPPPAPTTVMANSTAELPGLQGPVLGWARKRLDQERVDLQELEQSLAMAKKQRWGTTALRNARNKSIAAVTFYEKVVDALEAGYVLFPPVPNADVIAFRCGTPHMNEVQDTRNVNWERPRQVMQASTPLTSGEGDYYNPVPKWVKMRSYKTEKGEDRAEWRSLDLDSPQFPLAMAKPEIIEATNAAMEMRVFDEIRMFPFERRPTGDPCLLGTVIEKQFPGRQQRRHYFLISWRINESDI